MIDSSRLSVQGLGFAPKPQYWEERGLCVCVCVCSVCVYIYICIYIYIYIYQMLFVYKTARRFRRCTQPRSGGVIRDLFCFILCFMYKTARRFRRCTQPWLGGVRKRMLLSGVLMPLPVIRYVQGLRFSQDDAAACNKVCLGFRVQLGCRLNPEAQKRMLLSGVVCIWGLLRQQEGFKVQLGFVRVEGLVRVCLVWCVCGRC